MRLNTIKVELISKLEKVTHNCKRDCFKCVYREAELNRCWYLMVTNRHNDMQNNTCSHFVDWDDYNKAKDKKQSNIL